MRRIQAIGNTQAMVRTILGFEEAIRQTGGVREKMAHRDSRFAAINELRPKIRKPARYRIFQAELPPINERQRCHTDNRLRHRSQSVDLVLAYRALGFPVCETSRALIDDLAMLRSNNCCANDSTAADRVVDDGVQRSCPVPCGRSY